MSALYLVSCVAGKAAGPRPARDLYTSDWFLKARAYVESTGGRWLILSALYHCVSPDTVLAPYDFSLIQADSNDRIRRQVWSNTTADLIARSVFHGTPIVILAGHAYREFLTPALEKRGFPVTVPMAGLGIGQQKRWMMEHTARPAA